MLRNVKTRRDAARARPPPASGRRRAQTLAASARPTASALSAPATAQTRARRRCDDEGSERVCWFMLCLIASVNHLPRRESVSSLGVPSTANVRVTWSMSAAARGWRAADTRRRKRRTILANKQRSTQKELGEYAANRPDVDCEQESERESEFIDHRRRCALSLFRLLGFE